MACWSGSSAGQTRRVGGFNAFQAGVLRRCVVAVVAGLLAPAVLASPAEAKQARLRKAIKTLLVVKAETNQGYERSKFRHWIDGDGDCKDTRSEVLRQESKAAVTGDCGEQTGEWHSYYDGETWADASDVDIDHLVPLPEAWGSGAKRWTKGTRKRYANDLRDRRALVAVTDNVNQSKGAGDPPSGCRRRRSASTSGSGCP